MNKFIITCALLFVSIFQMVAEGSTPPYKKKPLPSDANVVGHVIDALTGEHVPGVTIQIKGTTFGTSTDATGHYFLRNIKPGEITLVMRGVGYLSQERTIVIQRNKVVEVNFEAEQDVVSIDEVVVSANRQATLRRLAPTIVNVVDEEVFSRANANNLAQGIIFQPGVRVENDCQNCGFNQVRINGLDGRYTQILIDSRPIFSALAGVYGIEQIPTNMIDRVEVVRGGGSALFGSSAIGGVVNIITKEPTRNSFSFGESLTFTGLTAPDNNLSLNASIVTDDNRAGAMVFGQARYRSAWDANGDGYSELGKLNGRSIGARTFLRTSDYSKLTAELHTIQEYRRGGDHLDWPDHVAGVSERVDHSIYSGNMKFDLFSSDYKHHFLAYVSGQRVNRNSYYGGIGEHQDDKGNRLGQLGHPIPGELFGINYGVTKGSTYMGGVQYSYDMDKLFFMPAQLLLGTEYVYDHLNDIMPIRNWYTEKDDKGNLIQLYPPVDQLIHNLSVLGQLEWKNDMFSLLLGGRLDSNSAVRNKNGNVTPIISPRATLRYNPTKDVNFRFSYAKGFRAPQVFDEDLHVGVVNGDVQRVTNVAGLKPETSHAFNLSADLYGNFGAVKTNFLIEGFYNQLKDVFVTEKVNVENGITNFNRINGSGAKVMGVNLEGKLAWNIFQFQAGFTLASNKYDAEEEWGEIATLDANGLPQFELDAEGKVETVSTKGKSTQITRTPSAYGYFTLGIEPVKNFNIALTGTYTGAMYAPHAIVLGTEQNEFAKSLSAEQIEDAFKKAGFDPTTTEIPEVHADRLVKTPSFFDLGFKFSYAFNIFSTDLEVYAGMNNVFNAIQKDFDFGPDRDSAYIYGPTQPRSAYMGLKFNF